MATITLNGLFNTNDFWMQVPLFGTEQTSATTYEYQSIDGLFVRVSGTGFTFDGNNNALTGIYDHIEVSTVNTFATLIGEYSTSSGISLASFFLTGPEPALSGSDTITGTPANFETVDYSFITNSMTVGAAPGSAQLSGLGAGVDTLTNINGFGTGGGDDTFLTFDSGNNTFNGNGGTDSITFLSSLSTPATGNITVNLTAGTASGTGVGTDSVLNFENVTTGSGNDTITGNIASNVIISGDGNDTLDGGGGGSDSLSGGKGNDTFVFDGQGNDSITDFGLSYFTAALSSANEVGGTTSTATAAADLTLNFAHTHIDLRLTANGLNFHSDTITGPNSDVTGFHFHDANAGVNGPIVHDILTDPQTSILGSFPFDVVLASWATASGLTPTLANHMLANGLYLNIHTGQFPGGAIRGQVTFGSTELDRIDVSQRNIGDMATAFDIMTDGLGVTTLTTFTNGVAGNLQIAGAAKASFTAANFVLQSAVVADAFTGTTNADYLFGAGGNDILTGGGGDDRLYGEADKDTLYGGAGLDRLTGGAGDDIMDGGAAVDTYIGGLGNDAYYVRNLGLDGRVEDIFTELANQGIDGVNTSVTLNLNEARYTNIENGYIVGTAATNLGGSAVNNVLVGNDAANSIYGLGGRDIMRGGLGVDTFVYLFNSDTGKTALTRDLIQDFTHLTDKIDVAAIDANGAVAGNNTFVFQTVKGAAFTHVAGLLHYLALGANTLIEGDLNGDAVADFQIELTGTITLTAADFVL